MKAHEEKKNLPGKTSLKTTLLMEAISRRPKA